MCPLTGDEARIRVTREPAKGDKSPFLIDAVTNEEARCDFRSGGAPPFTVSVKARSGRLPFFAVR